MSGACNKMMERKRVESCGDAGCCEMERGREVVRWRKRERSCEREVVRKSGSTASNPQHT